MASDSFGRPRRQMASGLVALLLQGSATAALSAQGGGDPFPRLISSVAAAPSWYQGATVRRPTGSAADVERAATLIRAAELNGNRAAVDQALTLLSRAHSAHPGWPMPGLLIARGLLVLNRSRAPVRGGEVLRDGEPYVDGAWRYLRSSLGADSTFGESRRAAARLLAAEGERPLRSDERAVMALLVRGATPEPDALLAWARDVRGRNQYDSAATILQRAMAAGGDRSRLALEVARTRMAQHNGLGAVRSYWEGVDSMTPTGREAYRHDLAWFLGSDSLAAFDRLPIDSVAPWLHRFWEERDAAAANHSGERIQEQLRRWNVAVSDYRVAIPWRRTQFTRVEYLFEGLDQCVRSNGEFYDLLGKAQPSLADDPRYREPLFDHRGLIYLRHGQPMRIVTGPGYGEAAPFDLAKLPDDPASRLNTDLAREMDLSMWQNEAWLYWIEGDWRVLNFRGSKALGTYAPTTLTSYLPVQNAAHAVYFTDWLVRAMLSPEYAAALNRIAMPSATPKSCLREVSLVIDKSRADSRVATQSDSDTPLIPDPWNAVLQLFALGAGPEHNGKALVSFAIPGEKLEITRPDNEHSIYAIDFRFVAYEPTTGQTISIDSTRRYLVADVLDHDQRISGWFELALPAGNWQVAVKVGQKARFAGAFALARDLRIGNGATLALSDIVLGRPDAPDWDATDGAPFPLNVQGAYPARGSAELFYEVRGVTPGAEYHTAIEVHPARASDPGSIRITGRDRAGQEPLHIRKTLGLERLRPGSYTLTVTVTSGGRSTSRSRPLLIAERER